jgi:hypothetical protein
MYTKEKSKATKWTAERVKEHLTAIMQDACGKDVSHLAIALVRQGLYKQIWGYWKKMFAGDEEIMVEMMRIDTVFEAKLSHSALAKKVSPWRALFGMKHNHEWDGKSQQPKAPGDGPQAYPHQGHELMPDTIIRLGNYEMIMYFRDPEWNGHYRKVTKEERMAGEQKMLPKEQ